MRLASLLFVFFGLACRPAPQALPQSVPAPSRFPAGKSLYQNGQVYTQPGDRFTCYGSPEEAQACQELRPSEGCALSSPVAYWESPMQCAGFRMPVEDPAERERYLNSLQVPACECSCSEAYLAAGKAYQQKILECSMMP